jgi:hypothetical protein
MLLRVQSLPSSCYTFRLMTKTLRSAPQVSDLLTSEYVSVFVRICLLNILNHSFIYIVVFWFMHGIVWSEKARTKVWRNIKIMPWALTYFLTELSPSWEAANCSAIQEIPSNFKDRIWEAYFFRNINTTYKTALGHRFQYYSKNRSTVKTSTIFIQFCTNIVIGEPPRIRRILYLTTDPRRGIAQSVQRLARG